MITCAPEPVTTDCPDFVPNAKPAQEPYSTVVEVISVAGNTEPSEYEVGFVQDTVAVPANDGIANMQASRTRTFFISTISIVCTRLMEPKTNLSEHIEPPMCMCAKINKERIAGRQYARVCVGQKKAPPRHEARAGL